MALTTAHFRGLLEEERLRLTNLCNHWENIACSETSIGEEVHGVIRTTVGQARLLMKERFSQFAGLIHVCDNNLGEKKTTCEDLQGFWDMVYFQVEDVTNKFEQLAKLQSNGWIPVEQVVQAKAANAKRAEQKTNPKVTKGSEQTGMSELQKARIAASRKRLAEAKARMASAARTPPPEVAVEKENVVFEAPGFFVVSSPARPKQHKIIHETPECLNKTPIKTPAQKDFSPLVRITRSAKKALNLHNF
ncbi:disks large-associated protein 5-like [Haemaphysalis longicornis]